MKREYSIGLLQKKMLPLLLAVILLCPLAAQAEIKAKSFELSPFIGYHFFEGQQNLENDFVFGGRVGYNFTNRFGIEGALEFINTGVDDKNQAFTSKGQFATPINDVDMTSFHLDALYHFMPESKLNPYIVAGFGAAHYNPSISDNLMAIVSYGVGAKYWLVENIGLRADLRDNMVVDETFHNVEATLGVIFRFGGDSKPEATPVAKYEPAPKPVVVAEKQVVVAPVKPEITVLEFDDVHFDFDKATLKPAAKKSLDEYIQVLKKNPRAKIRIEGYTSEKGTDEYNRDLSKKRADAVKSYLMREGGIKSSRLKSFGYGETDPEAYEANPEIINSRAAKKNMRVLFEIAVQ
ncbi:OmpA family protein [Geopsychrobacter electrodiphilus]|uniref:OmpA family protein n=1 Tax=Geopsychrobacter electrodiphilus TaxID=225196 RepID=UPI000368A07D|nr:OmpA family protein [Geopsychrobacter electrodiphilus]